MKLLKQRWRIVSLAPPGHTVGTTACEFMLKLSYESLERLLRLNSPAQELRVALRLSIPMLKYCELLQNKLNEDGVFDILSTKEASRSEIRRRSYDSFSAR